MQTSYPTEWPQFFTATILEWKHLLKDNSYKEIIIDSLRFLIKQKRIKLFAFVIMSNHIHLLWQMLPPFSRVQVQHSFMKFTAQQIKFDLLKNNRVLLEQFNVNAKDRSYQFWERNALTVDLFSPAVFNQKLGYIHNNPVKAGLCEFAEEYYYSSAYFYKYAVDRFDILEHYYV